MSGSDRESSDDDLIREILDLRPGELRNEAPAEAAAAQDELDDPFAASESLPDPLPFASKKRSRRLDDSDDDEDVENQPERHKGRLDVLSEEDDEDVPVATSTEAPDSTNKKETSDISSNQDIDHILNNDDDPAINTAPVLKSKLKKKRPVISESDNDENNTSNNDCEAKSKRPSVRRKFAKKRPLVSENDQDDRKSNRGKPKGLASQRLDSQRKRFVFSDESDSDDKMQCEDHQLDNGMAAKSKRPAISDSSDEDAKGGDWKESASWQSLDEGISKPRKHEPKKKRKPVPKTVEPDASGSDSDDSNLDKVILKKHCSAGRRQKYAPKPNPNFLDNLLRNISQRSLHLRLVSDTSNTKENSLQRPVTSSSNERSDSDSIELEFSGEEECKIYGQQFQVLGNERPNKPSNKDNRPLIAKDFPPSVKPTQKLQFRTQSLCGLYPNVGGQSTRQTMLKGLKKKSRIRRMNSLCADHNDSM